MKKELKTEEKNKVNLRDSHFYIPGFTLFFSLKKDFFHSKMRSKNNANINLNIYEILIFLFFSSFFLLSNVEALNFIVHNVSNPSQPYFVVNGSTGNAGIGTANPATKLTVIGNISSTDSVNATKLCFGTDCRSSWTGIGGNVSGDGVSNYLAKFNSASTLINSSLYEIGGGIGIGTTTPATKLTIYGSTDNTMSGVWHYKSLAHFSDDRPSMAGTMIVGLPKNWSNTMMQITIKGYDYSTYGTWEVVIGGYNYQPTPTWTNTNVEVRGRAPFTSVRLASNGTRNLVLLGSTTTTWQYPKVEVTDFIAGYGSQDGWGYNWSIYNTTDETGIINIVTPTIYTYTSSGGTFGIGTTTPYSTTKLHVIGSAYFEGNIETNSTSPFVSIRDSDNIVTDDAYVSYLDGRDRANTQSWWVGDGGGAKTISLLASNSVYNMSLYAGGNYRLWINGPRGLIGIGTVVPNDELEVAGNTRIEAISSPYNAGDLYFTDGTSYSANRSDYISGLAGLKGRLVNYNPDFSQGTYEYALYNNAGGTKVKIGVIGDSDSPSTSRKVLNVSYDGTGTPSVDPTPNYGGFYLAIGDCGSGNPTNTDCYIHGNRYVYRIWAKIPLGRSINFNTNAYGSEGSFRWISNQTGTGEWQQYVAVQKIGTSGTFSSTAYFSIFGGSNTAFEWYVGSVEIIGIDEPDTVEQTKTLNIGYKQNLNLSSGGLVSTTSTYLATDSGSVGLGTISPQKLLDVQGDAQFGSNNWLNFTDTGGGNGRLIVSATGAIDFGTAFLFRNAAGTTEYARFDSTGLGIGITSPTSKLHVNGTLGIYNSTGSVGLYQDNTLKAAVGTASPTHKFTVSETTLAIPQISANGISSTGRIAGYNLRIDSTNLWQLITDNADSNKFFLQYADSSSNRYLTMTTGGLVGIGTTTPRSTLDISASAYANLTIDTTATGNASLTIDRQTSASESNIILQDAGTTQWTLGTRSNNAELIFRNRSFGNNLYLSQQGDIGIGTNSPARRLDIIGDNSTVRVRSNSATGNVSFDLYQLGSVAYKIGSDELTDFFISEYDTGSPGKRMVIKKTTGNVGIGIANPLEIFHINSSSGTAIRIDQDSANNNVSIRFRAASTGQDAAIKYNPNSFGRIGFFVDNIAAGVDANEYLSILGNGKIGINTTMPNATLEVLGSIYFRGGSGDTDNSGSYAAGDQVAIGNALIGLRNDSWNYSTADIDGDGIVTLTDYTLAANLVGGTMTLSQAQIHGKIIQGRNFGISAADGYVKIGSTGTAALEQLEVAGNVMINNQLKPAATKDLVINATTGSGNVVIVL